MLGLKCVNHISKRGSSLHWPYHSPWRSCHRLRRSPLWYDDHSSQSAVPVSANPAALGRTSFLFVKWTYSIHVYHIKYARSFVVSALLWLHNPFLINSWSTFYHRPVTRYVKLQVAHAPVMPGTFSLPPTSKATASYVSRYASRHVRDRYLTRNPWASCQIATTHVPWCMLGSLTRSGGKTFLAFPAHAQSLIWHI